MNCYQKSYHSERRDNSQETKDSSAIKNNKTRDRTNYGE